MTAIEPTHLDGNALGGALMQVFGLDATAMACRCGGCGRRAAVADNDLYAAAGLVLRCRGCQQVLLRLVTASGRSLLDMSGLAWLELPEREVPG